MGKKKQIKGMIGTSMLGAAGSMGLGAIGGANATHGQQGIRNATRYMGATGSIMGAGWLTKEAKKVFKKK